MIDYKDFALHPSETLHYYKEFWFNHFSNLLTWYFPNRTDLMILYASREHNKNRYIRYIHSGLIAYNTTDKPCGINGSTDEYFFSNSVFFYVLLPQVIAKTWGGEAARLFHKASGWIRTSAGLGGNVSAERWLYASEELYPSIEKVKYYNALIDIVSNFHKQEIIDFMKGDMISIDTESYKSLCEIASGSMSLFEETYDKAIEDAKNNFANQLHPTYYLPEDIRYYF
jgi:hypothetical protein